MDILSKLEKFDCACSVYKDMHYDCAYIVDLTMWDKNHKYDSNHFVKKERIICEKKEADEIKRRCKD